MVKWLRDWWEERIVQRSLLTELEWQEAFQNLPLLNRLDNNDKARLKRLAILFLHYKTIEGVGEFEITPVMRIFIALQACLPILNLDLSWYEGWRSIIIYPGPFSRRCTELDEYGVAHEGQLNLSGESWQKGPVILSWDDVVHFSQEKGRNVVIHEFAHKLDMLNGRANGFPPLHQGMSAEHWSATFNQAYNDFNQRREQEPMAIDSYAATSPAEFFAVFSELFFEKPELINSYYPKLYPLLGRFYRQDPLGILLY